MTSRLPSALGYFWWCVCLHTLGVWRYGPLGYRRFRRDVAAAIDWAIRDQLPVYRVKDEVWERLGYRPQIDVPRPIQQVSPTHPGYVMLSWPLHWFHLPTELEEVVPAAASDPAETHPRGNGEQETLSSHERLKRRIETMTEAEQERLWQKLLKLND